jgi:transposase
MASPTDVTVFGGFPALLGLLRREGLYNQLISHWRKQRDKGASQAWGRPVGRPKVDPRDREIAKLKAEKERVEAEESTES